MAKDMLTGEAVPWHDFHKQYIDGSVEGDLPMTRLSEMFNVNHFIVSQVNPHVVPFLPKDTGPLDQTDDGESLIGRWMNTMSHLAKDEVLHRMNVLSELGVFPTSMTKLASVMNQKYHGDINIYPEMSSSHFPRILENPTTEFMLSACLSGERATWPRLSQIRNHCAIELALDSAIQQMRARVAFSPSQARLRLPNPIRQSTGSVDSGSGHHRRRRGSHSHELERRHSHTKAPELRKAHSTVSLETPPNQTRPKPQRRRSAITFNNAIFDGDSSSDEGCYTIVPRAIDRHHSLVNYGSRSPMGSRRSSLSPGSPYNPTCSPKAYAPHIAAPSPHNFLNMTPSVPNSPDSLHNHH